MTEFCDLIIEPLNSNHDRLSFQCGVESLDRYLKRQATQDVKRHISRVFIATKHNNAHKVLGYYTLSTLSIELNDLPEKFSKKLPKHPIPAALIGRLAVNISVQGYGVGKMLIADAIKRVLAVSGEIAIYAVVVDAVNDDAHNFYQQFGFTRLSDDSLRLFLTTKSIV